MKAVTYTSIETSVGEGVRQHGDAGAQAQVYRVRVVICLCNDVPLNSNSTGAGPATRFHNHSYVHNVHNVHYVHSFQSKFETKG